MASYTIEARPAYSVLKVFLEPGESVVVESGSYLLSRGNVEVKTTTGGIIRGLLRAIAGGESVFLNVITARDKAEVWIAPPSTGDIAAIPLDGEIVIQDSSYLAHIGDIEVSVAWRGLKGLIAEGELVWLKASGRGTVFVSSFGAIEEVEVPPGEKITVDNGHFVAVEGGHWEIRKFGGWKTFFLGGEGLVMDIYGPAKVWVQTRNLSAFAGLLSRFIGTSE